MKTISILKTTRKELSKIGVDKELSMDGVANYLLDSVTLEDDGTLSDRSRANIHLGDDTLERLKGCKAYPTEPYSSVFIRLLQKYNEQD